MGTVILAHGWTLQASCWQAVVDGLQQRRNVRVVTYDQPGHGASTSTRAGRPHIRELGGILDAVVREAAPEGSAVLGGHSMGGMSILAFAGGHCASFAAATGGVLLAGTAARIERRRSIPGERLFMGAMRRLPHSVPGVMLPPQMLTAGFAHDADRALVRQAARLQGKTRPRVVADYHLALMEFDERESLPALSRLPTRILVGEQDRLTPPRWAHAMADRIGTAQLDVIPQVGHMLPYEAPAAVAEALAALVDQAITPS